MSETAETRGIPGRFRPKPSRLGLGIALLILLALALWQTAHWARLQGLGEIRDTSRHTLSLTVSSLRGTLRKYEALPGIFATNTALAEFLTGPAQPAAVERTNRYLERVTGITGASDIYLMDRTGLTLAASNWQSPRPFVGRNFAFRPYYQQAMKGGLGRYFALGDLQETRLLFRLPSSACGRGSGCGRGQGRDRAAGGGMGPGQ